MVVHRLLGKLALIPELKRFEDGLVEALRRNQDHRREQDRHDAHGDALRPDSFDQSALLLAFELPEHVQPQHR